MVSRRKFFSIFIMMAVLLFMFQFSHIVRENSNSYKVNQYIAITKMNGSDRWSSEKGKVLETAVYVGSADSKTYEIVKQWGEYTKRKIETASSLEELSKQELSVFSMILLDGKNLEYSTKDLGVLTLACNNDVNLVFCNLPDAVLPCPFQNANGVQGYRNIAAQPVLSIPRRAVNNRRPILIHTDQRFVVVDHNSPSSQQLSPKPNMRALPCPAFGGK